MPREKHIPAPPAKGGNKAFLLSPKTEELIRKLAGRTDVELDVNQFEMIERNGVRHYRLRPTPEKPDRSGGGTVPPLWVTLFAKPAGGYEVTVGWGYVYEIIPGADDAFLPHEPANLWDETDPELPARFDIATGQAVYVKVHVTAEGTIGAPEPAEEEEPEAAVSIVIDEDSVSSIHYTPRVDTLDTEGSAGIIYYKLTVLEAGVGEGAAPKLKKFLTGSHIVHIEDLPAILSTLAPAEGIGVIPREWDDSARAYKLRAISKGFGKNTITTNSDHVEVRGTLKDAGVKIWYGDTPPSTPEIEWSDGYMSTGTTVIGTEETPPDPLLIDIKIPEVRVLRGLTITDPAVNGGIVFEVGLPEAAAGDMLRFDGTNWELLLNPGVPDSGTQWVPHHDGTTPRWESYEEKTIQICIEGVGPTPHKILAKPVV